ncbi:MAG: type II secretion system inner membrane protein GspF [Myxococcota bacterium]
MPVYAYKGVTAAGKATRGTLTAESARAARARMRQDGVFLTEIGEARATATVAGAGKAEGEGGWRIDLSSFQRIPTMEIALATRQLSTLVAAGIPLVEALGALTDQIEHGRLKSVIAGVRERVNEGSALADALQQTRQFDDLFVSMIRAGEAGGALEVVLARIADYQEEQVRLTNKVSSILIYPAVMLAFAGVVVIALVTVVLPQITSLLESLDQELPWYTVAIMSGSEFLRTWWWALALVGVALFAAFRQTVRTQRGRAAYDRFRLRMPVVGRIIRLIAIARITRTLSTLLGGGVSIVRALEISKHVANNRVIGDAIEDAKVAITEGATLAVPLRNSGQFPPMVTHMIEVGERSGALEGMLTKVAETYDEQVETTVSRLTSLLEPLLILLMVGIVLVIIMATLMPLLQITSSIS